MPWAKDLYLGLVFKGDSGQQTLPFLYKGLPVEYEIMRTLMTVGGSTLKKKVGIFKTDAPMMGSAGMGMMGISMGGGSPPWEFVAELRQSFPFYDAVWRGFRSNRFKYTVKGDKNGAEPWEFFDLENDPKESRDLALEQPQRVKKMRADLARWQKSVTRSLEGADYRR